jgi:hypothetical protein
MQHGIMNLLPIIEELVNHIASGHIEIYNEASVQYELAILLRKRVGSSYKVELERNISHFKLENKDDTAFKKKEMDIVIYDRGQKEKHCIELKYPLRGQFPIQMFKACEDIRASINRLIEMKKILSDLGFLWF